MEKQSTYKMPNETRDEQAFHQWVLEKYPPTVPKTTAMSAIPPLGSMPKTKPPPPRLQTVWCKEEIGETEDEAGQWDSPIPAPRLTKSPPYHKGDKMPVFIPLNKGKGWGKGKGKGEPMSCGFPTPLTHPFQPPPREQGGQMYRNQLQGWTPPAPPMAPPPRMLAQPTIVGMIPLWNTDPTEPLILPLTGNQSGYFTTPPIPYQTQPSFMTTENAQVVGAPVQGSRGTREGHEKENESGKRKRSTSSEPTIWIEMNGKRFHASFGRD